MIWALLSVVQTCALPISSLAVAAMGGVSGFASGLEGKQRFDTSTWLKPSESGGGGGSKRIFIAGLDRFVSTSEMREFFDGTRTSRQLFGCSDPSCCGDIDKMLRNPEARSEESRVGKECVSKCRCRGWRD